jgi:predicted nuclease of restriction endonuclease-like RecB superfamily
VGRVFSPEHREKLRQAKLLKPTNFWLGKKRGPHSVETKVKMSASHRGKPRRIDQHRFEYGGTWFRSTWEVRVARALDALGVRWQYEPKRIDLGTQTYLPDFYLPDDGAYWEVKGFFGDKSRRTTELFRQLRPEPLVLVTKAVLYQLEHAAARAA